MALGLKSTSLELLELGGEGVTTGTHQRPRSTPHAHFADACWIVMKPRKVLSMSAIARAQYEGEEASPVSSEVFKFLAPNDIQENVGHTWEEYESITSRLANKIAGASRAISEGKGAIKGGGEALKLDFKGEQKLMGQLMNRFNQAMVGQTIPNRKIDAGMTYTNSERRQLTLDFTLIDEGNPNFDIVDPVNRIRRYSCAHKTNFAGIKFELPYLFEIYTEPQKFIWIKTAALTAVQPTYKGPYRNGLPSVCELQLTFMDISPLYRDSFNPTERISITSTLTRHIPHADKLNKFASYTDRVQQQLDTYQKQYPGTLTNAGGTLSESVNAQKGDSGKTWSELLAKFQQGK